MNISEQNKQEAEKVVEMYSPFTTYEYMGDWHDDIKSATKCAIQDRQSVLEENKTILMLLRLHKDILTKEVIELRITNLTEQIEYLQSKL